MATRTCRICGRVCAPGVDRSYGRCQMCARYWRRHGAERPPLPSGHLERRPGPGARPRAAPQPCSHCGRLVQARSRERCPACYQYWRRHGVERPLEPCAVRSPRGRMTTRVCRICGRVCAPGVDRSYGRCQMCAWYWRRHGVERPPVPPGQLERPRPLPRPRAAPQPCSHCGRLAQNRSRGRCMACYQYRRRYGRERPLAPRPVATLRPCAHCGRLTRKPVRGRCAPCYQYWHRHGTDRPPVLLDPQAPRPCQTCGQLTPGHRRGRCPACYMYWYRHGVERPRGPRPPPPLRPCQTCARLVPEFHRGRCPACYSYWHRTGRERPARLWQR
jgi:hypothetical protein